MSDRDVLKQVYELNGPEEIRKPGDYLIKLARPKKLKQRVEEEGDRYLAEVTDPEKEAPDLEYLTHRESFDSFNPEDIESLKEIQWGDFDIEKIVEFLSFLSEQLSGSPLHTYQLPFQKRIFRSVLLNDGEVLTALFSRQAGKTQVLAGASASLMLAMPVLAERFPEQLGDYKNGFWVGVYSPNKPQAELVYNRATGFITNSRSQEILEDPDIGVKSERRKGYYSNGSRILAQSADPTANIEGWTNHLIIIDESQGVDESVIMKSVLPTGAWTNATVISIGTPDEKPCWFYDRIQSNRFRDLKTRKLYQNHYEANYEEVIKCNPRYEKHVNQQIRQYGIESRHFQMKYCLRWFFEEGRPVSDADFKKYLTYFKVPPTKTTDAPVVVGIDVAKERYSTVVTVGKYADIVLEYTDKKDLIKGIQVCDWLELTRMDYIEQRPIIKNFLERYSNIRVITIDSTGGGTGFYEQAVEEWRDIARRIEPFVFGDKTKGYLASLFEEYFYSYRLLIPSSDDIRKTTKWQNFYLQLVNLERAVKNGYTVFQKNSREGSKDDYPDSLFLMLHSAKIAEKQYRSVSVDDNVDLYSSSRVKPPSSFEEFRRAAQTGQLRKSTLREQRLHKLLQGNL